MLPDESTVSTSCERTAGGERAENESELPGEGTKPADKEGCIVFNSSAGALPAGPDGDASERKGSEEPSSETREGNDEAVRAGDAS